MRKFLIVTLALMLVLGFSGVALAGDNDADIRQHGDYNLVLVYQSSDYANNVVLIQDGYASSAVDNFAGVVQISDGTNTYDGGQDAESVNELWLVQIDIDAHYNDFWQPDVWVEGLYHDGLPDWSRTLWPS